ncbi:Regulatory protein RecX [Nitrospira sp. KM1]|uniref:regulatory protein RecX n=1 Tax=Nitrospira sp. KM1 TaxID=1936990 RepID=UPI0013A750BB|nr:regulatory protein RecX [Nitrospira sp. KM1]BCA53147.1 Regulatory protein RecX [Nitrospira sp. KM1]
MLPLQPERWLQSAVRYLARFDRTTAQLERFLRNKGASPSQAKQTVERLVELKYVDDLAYAERWIENRLNRKPVGRARLKAELLARSVPESPAARAIQNVLDGIDEETLARQALRARSRRGASVSPQRVPQLLRQWGFEDETIERIMGEYTEPEG